jgi:[ribosomal protein S5]-alanine N-acetyltransferase
MAPLQFDPFPELHAGRLLLRRMKEEDAPEIFFLRSEPAVMQYLTREPATTVDDAVQHIRRINKFIDENKSILWGIAFRDQPGKLIGTICLYQFDPDNSRTEIGYELHPEHWGKGIMKSVILRVLDYGYQQLDLHTIAAQVSPGNLASCRVLESTGFSKEGYQKENLYFNGQFVDTALYAKINPWHLPPAAKS